MKMERSRSRKQKAKKVEVLVSNIYDPLVIYFVVQSGFVSQTHREEQ